MLAGLGELARAPVNAAPVQAATLDILAKNVVLLVLTAVSSGHLGELDCGDGFCSSSMVFNVCVLGHSTLPLDEILPLHETPKWLPGLENVPRASVHFLLVPPCSHTVK